MKTKEIVKKCPKCKSNLYVEDNRCDTDRGTMGSEFLVCEKCDYTGDLEDENMKTKAPCKYCEFKPDIIKEIRLATLKEVWDKKTKLSYPMFIDWLCRELTIAKIKEAEK